MVYAREICDFLDKIAPFDTAMSFDNVGLLIGSVKATSTKVLIALDATGAVLEEAHRLGAKIVVTHHPVIFEPLKALETNSVPYIAARLGITVISAHTNLDIAPGGVNDSLAQAIGVSPLLRFDEHCALVGELADYERCPVLARHIRDVLKLKGLRYSDNGREIRTVLVSCGAGGSNVPLAVQCGADAILTGEIKHNQILLAREHDMAVFDTGHFGSEALIIPLLKEQLSRQFRTTEFVQAKADTDGMLYLSESD